MQSCATIQHMSISAQQFRELLDRYLNNTASHAERDVLDMFFDSYGTDLSDPGFPENNPRLQNEILQTIHSRIGSSAKPDKNSLVRLWLPVAAAISIFVLAYFFINKTVQSGGNQYAASTLVEEKTSKGQKLLTILSDGTKVYLNGESKILFPQAFSHTTREVTVTGEAFFEVVKDVKPFIVHATQIKTEVLGTSFNIKNPEGGAVEVTLVEGSVNIVTPSGKSSILKPNQQAVVPFNTAEIITKEVNILRYTSWKDNILYFEQTTLKEAISTLESWYAVRIDIQNPALEKCVITAKYQDEPLGNVLSSFQFLLSLNITRMDEGHFTITGKGCK